MRDLNPEYAEVGEPIVTLRMPKRAAEEVSAALADLLCWVRGFKAACPEESDRHPMGDHLTRELRIKLNRAIEDAKE